MLKSMTNWWRRDAPAAATPADDAPLVLDRHSFFQGSLRSRSTVRIEGTVENSYIETAANIIIAESAQVSSQLSACIVSIRGRYHGHLVADRVEVLAGARVSGHMRVNNVYIDEQAVMDADMDMLHPGEARAADASSEITTDVVTRIVDRAPRPPVEIGT